jgi:hypothetical protein
MKFSTSVLIALSALTGTHNVLAFAFAFAPTSIVARRTALGAIGLGPAEAEEQIEKVPEEEIEEPDHELFRDSRLTTFDKQCDNWYGDMLKQGEPSYLGKVSEEAKLRLNTLPKLEQQVSNACLFLCLIFSFYYQSLYYVNIKCECKSDSISIQNYVHILNITTFNISHTFVLHRPSCCLAMRIGHHTPTLFRKEHQFCQPTVVNNMVFQLYAVMQKHGDNSTSLA